MLKYLLRKIINPNNQMIKGEKEMLNFNEKLPIISQVSICNVNEVINYITKCNNRKKYAFYLSKELVEKFIQSSTAWIKLTKDTDGNNEVIIKHVAGNSYILTLKLGRSQAFCSNVYRVESFEVKEPDESEFFTKYIPTDKIQNFCLFDIYK